MKKNYSCLNQNSNKRMRTIDARQVCHGNILSIFVPKNDRKFLSNRFFDSHRDQTQNDELSHHKSTIITLDDSRRQTQLGGTMVIANTSLLTNVQDNDEEIL